MIVTFNCPYCDMQIEADGELGGDKAQCPNCDQTILVPAAGIEPGTTLGGYEVVKRLGIGGMGEVFLARQVAMDRDVALKVLPPAMTKNSELVERFLHEVRMAAKLEHPNIVAAFDAGTDGGYYYMAMSFVEGEDLDDRLARTGPLSEKEGIDVALAMAHALEYAWTRHKILHRDIKPANVMIDKVGDTKLMDMGIAKSLNEDSSLTMAGTFVGTPYYMSPEQAKNTDELDCRVDIYSLGASLYHLLTGHYPFEGKSPMAVLSQHLAAPLPSPQDRNPDISDAVAYLIFKSMAKNRDRRYIDWAEMIADLERLSNADDVKKIRIPMTKREMVDMFHDENSNAPATLVRLLKPRTSFGEDELIGLKPETSVGALPLVPELDDGVLELAPEEPPQQQDAAPAAPPPAPAASSGPQVPAAPAPVASSGPQVPAAPESSGGSAPQQVTLMPASAQKVLPYVSLIVIILVVVGIGAITKVIMDADKRNDAPPPPSANEIKAQQEHNLVVDVEGAIAEHQTKAEQEAKLKNLQGMLDYAGGYLGKNPGDYEGAISKFELVKNEAAGTQFMLVADEEIDKLKTAQGRDKQAAAALVGSWVAVNVEDPKFAGDAKSVQLKCEADGNFEFVREGKLFRRDYRVFNKSIQLLNSGVLSGTWTYALSDGKLSLNPKEGVTLTMVKQ
jgi:serine/threonine-protein kinase